MSQIPSLVLLLMMMAMTLMLIMITTKIMNVEYIWLTSLNANCGFWSTGTLLYFLLSAVFRPPFVTGVISQLSSII